MAALDDKQPFYTVSLAGYTIEGRSWKTYLDDQIEHTPEKSHMNRVWWQSCQEERAEVGQRIQCGIQLLDELDRECIAHLALTVFEIAY